MKLKVAISLTTFAQNDRKPLALLEKKGWRVQRNPFGRTVTAPEIIELAKDAQGLIAGTENLSAEILGKLKSLKVISRCGAGLDNVDLNAAKKLGIKVFSTPDGPTTAVAELVIALILNLSRQISLSDRNIRQGLWQKKMGSLFSGKNIGIIGFGRTGQAVAKLAGAFKAKVFYCDPAVKPSLFPKFKRLSLDQLLKISDFVTVHVPLVEGTKHLIGRGQLALMKKEAFLINCSRGGVVEETALYSVLKENKIAGAAVDVFEQEPYQGPLKDLDNIILTPHIGSYAKESRIQMEIEAVRNLIKGLQNKNAK